MTVQERDHIRFQGADFGIVSSEGGPLFRPEEHGLEPTRALSTSWRGYRCVYEVEDMRLVVREVAVWFPASTTPPGPLLGRAPDVSVSARHAVFRELSAPTHFTGGLLVGTGFIQELHARHLLLNPIWKFREVHELVFRYGALVSATDCSECVGNVREQLCLEPPNAEGASSSWELERWVSRCFGRRYKRFSATY